MTPHHFTNQSKLVDYTVVNGRIGFTLHLTSVPLLHFGDNPPFSRAGALNAPIN